METMRYEKWAVQEFGDAALGILGGRGVLYLVGAGCAAHPAGKVTEVFAEGAEREGAYRLLENERVPVAEIAAAAHRAGVRRTWGQPHVFVPIDGSSLNIVDIERQKGLDTVGSFTKGASGLCVMRAVLVLTCGTPAGLGGQYFWSREAPVHRESQQFIAAMIEATTKESARARSRGTQATRWRNEALALFDGGILAPLPTRRPPPDAYRATSSRRRPRSRLARKSASVSARRASR